MFFYIKNKKYMDGGLLSKAGGVVTGFTLVEVLVAISVFAVLVSIVLGSLSFLLSKTASMREGLGIYEEARICMDRVTTDLRAVYVSVAPGYEPPDLDDDPDPYRFFCEASRDEDARLEFTAFSHLTLGGRIPTRAGRIVYYLWKTEGDSRVLMRRDLALKADDASGRFSDHGDDGTDPILCRNVKRFSLLCFNEDGTEYDSWDSDSSDFSYATPVAVRVSLEIEGIHADYQFESTVSLPVFRKKAAGTL